MSLTVASVVPIAAYFIHLLIKASYMVILPFFALPYRRPFINNLITLVPGTYSSFLST